MASSVDAIAQEEDSGSTSNQTQQQSSLLLTCSFNQNGGCLAIGTTDGFSVYNLHPQYGVSMQRTQGGIGLVEMMFRCSLMALVGGGPSPQAPPHRVLLWDDNLTRAVGELSFQQVVLSVKLQKDAIAVALRDRVYLYYLEGLTLRDKMYTYDNPHGLLCLSTQQSQHMVLACPSVSMGHVRVEVYGLGKTQLIEAHITDLRALALTADGAKLASASAKGTIIRIWDVATGSCTQEFRRGVEQATITCICWSMDGSWLSCASDKGTCHAFQVEESKNDMHNNPHNGNVRSKSLTSRLFSEAEKSVCQVRGVPNPHACAFVSGANNLLAVAGLDTDDIGVVLLCQLSKGEEPRHVGYHVLCKTSAVDRSEEAHSQHQTKRQSPQIPETPESPLCTGEQSDVIFEARMQQIQFDDTQDHGFVTVTTTQVEKPTNESSGTTDAAESIATNDNDAAGTSKKMKE